MIRSPLERFLEDCLVREVYVNRWPNVSREKRQWARAEAKYLAGMLEERFIIIARLARGTERTSRKEARDCIADLLARIDDYAGEGMHLQGQTPDWYVKAALISCGLPVQTEEGEPT